MTHDIIDSAIAELGLTIESTFVPFSRSRNKGEKHKSLNWRVTVKCNGRDVLSTDYSAGIAHCPSFGTKPPSPWPQAVANWVPLATDAECESGFATSRYGFQFGHKALQDRKRPILPDTRNVIYSLVMDSSVLDAGGFESWAADLDYDTDSRKAESIYRACLEIALSMRAALGDEGMRKLQDAFQDY